MVLGLTIISAMLLFAIFVRRLNWGLNTLLVVLPFERLGTWALNSATGHPIIRPSQLVGVALILAYFCTLIIYRRRFADLKFWPYILLLLFLVAAGVPVIGIAEPALLISYLSLVFVSVLTAVVAAISKNYSPKQLALPIFSGALIASLFGLFQFFGDILGLGTTLTGLRPEYTKAVFGFPRIQSFSLEPLYYANYLLLPLFLALSLLLFRGLSFCGRLLLFSLVLGLNFVLTMSRGAFLAVILSLFVFLPFLWLSRKQLSLSWIPRLVPVTALVSLVLLGYASSVSKNNPLSGIQEFAQQTTVKLTTTGSFTHRDETRQQAYEIFQDQPFTGVGIGGISQYIQGYPDTQVAGNEIGLNNQFFELLAETGIFGAVLFYAFLFSLLVMAGSLFIRNSSTADRVLLLAFSLTVTASTVQAQSFSGFLLTHVWVSYGLLAGAIMKSYIGQDADNKHAHSLD